MRKFKKGIFLALLLVIVCTVFGCTNPKEDKPTNSSNELQIFNADLKLTQEQVLSQIRADKIKENNGYKDNDEIIVMLSLDGDALIDTYLDKFSTRYENVSEFAESPTGQAQLNKLARKQQNIIQSLENQKLILSVEQTYQTVINAIAVKVKYKNFNKLASQSNVSNVIISETYNKPQATKGTVYDVVENVVDVYETGIYKSDSVEFTGKGTSVAVLDSGFDCSHEVFNRKLNNDEIVLTQQSISQLITSTNASKTTKDLDLMDVFYSNKIPFAYDYADKDPDVFPYDSEHGTHVAGIIGGNSSEITGVAIDTQLVLLKVFPDLDDGAKTEDILAALEDAVLLGVDCINMSLGSSCGFSREKDGDAINTVYEKIGNSGINLLTAASNSYSSGFGGAQGNTNLVTNPDSSTVGSPSTYAQTLSVASISGVKSRYLIANDETVIFFKESNSINGKEGDFFKELYSRLGKNINEDIELEYVLVPGVGKRVNYSGIDVKGKIALVRRGDNSFEDKALQAKNAGAVACIIYNNIDGDIIMSMGKTDHIPTISISKDDGTKLAETPNGTFKISYNNQAGPFMSDFSSWGPTPDLKLKPEITAHGGNIKSSIPGGKYDELSGTSMATPNLCGVMVLIRQFLKEKYPTKTAKEISVLANQYMMSTASIILNEEGNPYSPRKQGAGLALLFNAVNTNAYLTVDDNEKTKLELLDDKNRTGIYNMEFNVVNTSSKALNYTLDLIGMTESVSTSDETHVREMAQILNGNAMFTTTDGVINDNVLTVAPNQTVKVKVKYVLTEEDKKLIDKLFPYGMYVEGFVKLESNDKDGIDLNVPFLAFYGDWLEAPLFDKTYYEVESEAHDMSINEEDKIKADYYATTPYGSYFYNYIIPLGTYLYDIDTELYDYIPASKEHIAISDTLGTIDGISSVYGGLLRNAKEMRYTIVDKTTGETVWSYIDYNANKAHSYGSDPTPYYDFIRLKSSDLGLVNNRQYEFKMVGVLDYGNGGLDKNVRNTFGFDFYLDNEAPVIKKVTYDKVYDKNLKKDRYYINMTVYDNQYAMSITPIIFTSSSSYSFLTENPIPVYSEQNSDTVVRFEITDYLDQIYNDELITSALAFSVDDYALNSNIYLCQLPGTKGEFKFTSDGDMDSSELMILSINEGEVIDLTKYLATGDVTVDENKDYLSHLTWKSSNENVVEVKEGLIKGIKAGKATITVSEAMELNQAVLIVNVKENKKSTNNVVTPDASETKIKEIKFSYFDTLFAYSRAAQTSEIGDTGSRIFISSLNNGISFYPGEKIQLFHDFDPWYAEDNYELAYASSNPLVATVDEDGVVTGLKEGTTYITLSVAGSTLMARVRITIKSEFVIENRTLIAYKGLGGEVVIPDDEGILYIGAYAFCLYDTDRTIELPEDDYDANKIPSMNTSITSITIPEGVEDIQKYAFYNCSSLRKVVIPDSVKYIREFAFCKDEKLEEVNINNAYVIGAYAFYGCENLKDVELSNVYAIGKNAFQGCSSIKNVNLTSLRNAGKEIFMNCTSLENIVLTEHTKLSEKMFANTGVKTIDLYETYSIPKFAFAKCEKLETINLHNNLYSIGFGAFSDCTNLKNINVLGTLDLIDEQSFYNCENLNEVILPNNDVIIGEYAFLNCTNLNKVKLGANTKILDILGSSFRKTNIYTIEIDQNNPYYNYDAKTGFLTNKDKTSIILAIGNFDYNDLVIDNSYTSVSSGAFTGTNIVNITFQNKDIVIGDYAFKNCETITTVTFPTTFGATVGKYAFYGCKAITNVNNLENVAKIDNYAFSNTTFKKANIGSNVVVGEGAFFTTGLEEVAIGANSKFGLGAFQANTSLKVVRMAEEGNIHFGVACFANCTQLMNIDLSKTDSVIEKETFYKCKYLKTANLLNVKEVGEYAFADCQSLSYINIPIVETIGEGAFGRYDQYGGAPTITSITLPNTLTSIGNGAFLGCNSLVEITIPSSITEIDDYMFAYCTTLEKVTLPASLTRIGKYSFAGCESLYNIDLSEVCEIDDYAFAATTSLNNVNLNSLIKAGDGAFAGSAIKNDIVANDLEEIGSYAFQSGLFTKFEAKNVKTIADGAFSYSENLKSFTISRNIEKFGKFVFAGCTSLESLNYLDNNELKDTGIINDYALLNNGLLYIVLPSKYYELKAVPGNLKQSTIEIMPNTVRIDAYAGNENSNVYKIVLPDGLRLIGDFAFYNYKNLEVVEFRSVTAPVLESTYNSALKLTENDPGYELLHAAFDLFGLDLCYTNFKNLAGKEEPISMILPANEDLIGYDSIIYQAYFGLTTNAQISKYVAMEQNMIDFIEYYKELAKVSAITLTNEEAVNNAMTAFNRIKADYRLFGYTEEEWNEMYQLIKNANEVIKELKYHTSSTKVKEVQEMINGLGTKFSVNDITILTIINTRFNALKGDEQALLDLTKYNNLLDSYNEYIDSIVEESNPFTNKYLKGDK